MLIPVRMLEEKHGEKPDYPGFSIEPKSNNEKSGGPSEMGGSVRHGHQCPPYKRIPQAPVRIHASESMSSHPISLRKLLRFELIGPFVSRAHMHRSTPTPFRERRSGRVSLTKFPCARGCACI